jgi:hypothetical protein
MSIYLKISSYLIALYLSFRIRVYFSNIWRKNNNINNENIDQNYKQLVLFFPEKEIQLRNCRQINGNYH